jgi:hypothetical protein
MPNTPPEHNRRPLGMIFRAADGRGNGLRSLEPWYVSSSGQTMPSGPNPLRRSVTGLISDYLRSFPGRPAFFVRCQDSHQEQRYARSSFGALVVAIWCAAVASASPSLAYIRFPLTGHFESVSTGCPPRNSPFR